MLLGQRFADGDVMADPKSGPNEHGQLNELQRTPSECEGMDRERVEQELRASRARLAGILDNAEDAIISVDSEQRVTLFNRGAEQIFGYSTGEIVGQPLSVLMPERFRVSHHAHIEAFGRGPFGASRMGSRGQIMGRRKDGTEFPAEATILKQEGAGGFEYTTILRDASEQRRIEHHLEQRVADRTQELRDEMRRHQEAQEAVARLQRMEALGQLTGGIAHDFNNLLTVISGNLELIGMDLEDARPKKYLEEAQRAAEMGARLNQRLMTFAKQRRLAPAPLNLNDQVIGVRELLRRSLGEAIILTTELADNLWTVQVDASEIENALVNLAVNARDAMPEGGNLTVATRNIVVGSAQAKIDEGLAPGSYVVLSIADTGLGMTPEVMTRAFEPFFTTKSHGKGTGLGLATIYGFVKQSGGHIALQSEVGRGTTLSIYLPRFSGADGEALAVNRQARAGASQGETILVVEDNTQVRSVTMERLKTLGYRALEAEGGQQALQLLSQSDEKIDLVFSDVVMPGGLSGFDLARRIKENWPDKRILLTSGFSAATAPGTETDDLEILAKPYSQAALAQAIRRALQVT